MNKAVVVAHPDDETLWASSQCEGADVICCTVPYRDPERAIKFFEAVRILGGYPILIPFQESIGEPIPHLREVDLSRYDTVVTHNADGEYGHLHHIQVHQYVVTNFHGRIITFGGEPVAIDQEKKARALMVYDHISSTDQGKPKWQALLDRYQIDLGVEYFAEFRNS